MVALQKNQRLESQPEYVAFALVVVMIPEIGVDDTLAMTHCAGFGVDDRLYHDTLCGVWGR